MEFVYAFFTKIFVLWIMDYGNSWLDTILLIFFFMTTMSTCGNTISRCHFFGLVLEFRLFCCSVGFLHEVIIGYLFCLAYDITLSSLVWAFKTLTWLVEVCTANVGIFRPFSEKGEVYFVVVRCSVFVNLVWFVLCMNVACTVLVIIVILYIPVL